MPRYIQICSKFLTKYCTSVNKDEVLILQVRDIVESLLINRTAIRLIDFITDCPFLRIHHRPIYDDCRFSECLSARSVSIVEEHEVGRCKSLEISWIR